MNREQQDIELIEGYLHQTLDEEKMRLFHEKRIMDDEFAALFYDMEVLTEGIKRSAAQTSLEEKLERLQKIMNESEEEYESEAAEIRIEGKTQSISYFRKYSYAVAASLALMVLAAIALLNINRLPTNEKLFAQYFVPFDNSGPTTKRGDSANGDELRAAINQYNYQNYDAALDLFSNMDPQTAQMPIIHIYKGNTLLALGRVDEAEAQFKEVLEIDKELTVFAKWYLGLCLLKQDNPDAAKPYFEELANSKSSFSKDASEILDNL